MSTVEGEHSTVEGKTMRRHKLLVVAAIVLPVIAYACWVGHVKFHGPHIQSNILVGTTEVHLRSDYGPPKHEWQGYQPLALSIPPSLPPEPIRTLIFHPQGFLHPEGGTLWVWVSKCDGEWVCFESLWYADGVQF